MSSIAKKLVIVVILVVVSSVFWFYVKPWVESPFRFSEVSIWLTPLLLLIGLAPLIALALTLFKSWVWEFLISAAVAMPFIVVFNTTWLYLTGVVILFLLFLHADWNINRELDQRTKVNSQAIMQYGLNSVMTGILIVVSFAYFLSPAVQQSATSKKLPPTIQQVINATVESFLGQKLDQLPPAERTQTKNQVIYQVTGEFTRVLGPYFRYLPPVLAFGMFLVLRGLSFVFIWFSIWLGQLVFWILRKTRFVTIEEKEIKAEVLVRL